MELNKQLGFRFSAMACVFRSIRSDDVTDSYVAGLKRQRAYLENNPAEVTVETQRAYVDSIVKSEANVICGLFIGGELIGTAGMQNVVKSDPATIGIFVFDPTMRGRGYGKTLVWAGCRLLNECNGAAKFAAGMKKDNRPSLNSFLCCGFRIAGETPDEYRVEAGCRDLKQLDSLSDLTVLSHN